MKRHSKISKSDGEKVIWPGFVSIQNLLFFRREKGRSGFYVWRYLLRRDDPSLAPWEEGAKKYQCIVPDLCKDEAADAENPTKKIKLEKFVLDDETKKLADDDEVSFDRVLRSKQNSSFLMLHLGLQRFQECYQALEQYINS